LQRNRDNRMLQKLRKKKRQMNSEDWRSKSKSSSGVVVQEQSGFWNSCSEGVRQELIDSKARMHILQNEQRAQEAKERISGMQSPIAIMKKVVALADQAEKIANKEGNAKVMSWAQTVATSEAESLARSAPSTVPSYDAVHKSVSVVDPVNGTPDSCLVGENEALKGRLVSVEAALKASSDRVSFEKHAAVLKRVVELEKLTKSNAAKSKIGISSNTIVCDGMTEWQIKDLKKLNAALELETSQARAWKAKLQREQVKSKSSWFS